MIRGLIERQAAGRQGRAVLEDLMMRPPGQMAAIGGRPEKICSL
jgi:hypothetical protein